MNKILELVNPMGYVMYAQIDEVDGFFWLLVQIECSQTSLLLKELMYRSLQGAKIGMGRNYMGGAVWKPVHQKEKKNKFK